MCSNKTTPFSTPLEFDVKKGRLYSNTGTNKKSKTRVDRIYVPSTTIDQIISTLFHETEKTGHKIVEFHIFKDVDNGHGSWAFKNHFFRMGTM